MIGKGGKFKDLLRETFVLNRNHWLRFIKIVLIFFVPVEIVDNYFLKNSTSIQKSITEYSLITFIVDNMINIFVYMFLLLCLIAVVKMIHASDQGKKQGTLYSYKQALGIFWPYLWVKIHYLFKVLCWAVFFIIPGIVFGVFYNFSGMTLLIDNKRGAEALILSQNIIKPNLLKYLSYMLQILISLLAACWLLITIFDSFILLLTLKGNIFMARMVDYMEIVFIAMAGFYFLTFYYYLYKDLKKEGLTVS